MTATEAAARWAGLPEETRQALQRTALLHPAPVPPWLVAKDDRAFAPAFAAGLASRTDHELWGVAVVLDPALLAHLKASPRLSDDELRAAVTKFVTEYCNYFVWPPTEMLWNAEAMEPHAATTAELARSLGAHDDLARLQHQRALLLAWRSRKFVLPLEYATEATAAFRKTGGGKPHPGTLALILTGLASWQESLRQHAEARASLLEAESLLVPLVGKASLEPFLLYCQLGAVCEALGDPEGASRARHEARTIGATLGQIDAEKHLRQTLSWAQWNLQRFIGF
jgi:hypothetical protein